MENRLSFPASEHTRRVSYIVSCVIARVNVIDVHPGCTSRLVRLIGQPYSYIYIKKKKNRNASVCVFFDFFFSFFAFSVRYVERGFPLYVNTVRIRTRSFSIAQAKRTLYVKLWLFYCYQPLIITSKRVVHIHMELCIGFLTDHRRNVLTELLRPTRVGLHVGYECRRASPLTHTQNITETCTVQITIILFIFNE